MTKISFKHKTFINILKLVGGRQILAKQFERGRGATAAPSKGRYIAGFSYFYFPMMGEIAQQSGANLVAPDYPLYPHIDAAGTHEWIRAHFDQTIEQQKPSKVILMGDSAGANAAMILAQGLVKSNIRHGSTPRRTAVRW